MTFTRIGQSALTKGLERLQEGGPQHGETTAIASPANTTEIAAFLSKHNPKDMDKAAISRASQHGVGLTVRSEGRYPNSGPSYTVAVGCEVTGTAEQRKAALADLVKFQAPAPARNIEAWVVELTALTAGKSPEGVSAEVMLTAYASRLSQYPADVVKHALTQRSWKWFPSWDELEKVCEAMAGPRRHMIAALSKPIPDPEPKRRPATDEEKARIQSLVDDMFPDHSAYERKKAVDLAMQGNCMKGSE